MSDRGRESSVVVGILGRILGAELTICVVVAGIALAHGPVAAYSAFLGGLACFIPDAYFAARVFGGAGVRAPAQVAGSWLRAEVAKLVLSVVVLGFIIAFTENLNMLALVLGYALVKTAGVVATARGADAGRPAINASGNQAHG